MKKIYFTLLIFSILSTVKAQINLDFITNKSLRDEVGIVIDFIYKSPIIHDSIKEKNIYISFVNAGGIISADFSTQINHSFFKIEDGNIHYTGDLNDYNCCIEVFVNYNHNFILHFFNLSEFINYDKLKLEQSKYKIDNNNFLEDEYFPLIPHQFGGYMGNSIVYEEDDNKNLILKEIILFDLPTFFKLKYNLEEITQLPSPEVKQSY